MITFVKILLVIVGLSLLATIILAVMGVSKWWIPFIIFGISTAWAILIATFNNDAFTSESENGNKMVYAYGRQ